MPDRPIYVYQLDVEYPEGDPPIPDSWKEIQTDVDQWSPPPHWPAVRRYLHQGAAQRRAALLRSMGCKVKVVRSKPVVFERSE